MHADKTAVSGVKVLEIRILFPGSTSKKARHSLADCDVTMLCCRGCVALLAQRLLAALLGVAAAAGGQPLLVVAGRVLASRAWMSSCQRQLRARPQNMLPSTSRPAARVRPVAIVAGMAAGDNDMHPAYLEQAWIVPVLLLLAIALPARQAADAQGGQFAWVGDFLGGILANLTGLGRPAAASRRQTSDIVAQSPQALSPETDAGAASRDGDPALPQAWTKSSANDAVATIRATLASMEESSFLSTSAGQNDCRSTVRALQSALGVLAIELCESPEIALQVDASECVEWQRTLCRIAASPRCPPDVREGLELLCTEISHLLTVASEAAAAVVEELRDPELSELSEELLEVTLTDGELRDLLEQSEASSVVDD